jgi:hypothetical protein
MKFWINLIFWLICFSLLNSSSQKKYIAEGSITIKRLGGNVELREELLFQNLEEVEITYNNPEGEKYHDINRDKSIVFKFKKEDFLGQEEEREKLLNIYHIQEDKKTIPPTSTYIVTSNYFFCNFKMTFCYYDTNDNEFIISLVDIIRMDEVNGSKDVSLNHEDSRKSNENDESLVDESNEDSVESLEDDKAKERPGSFSELIPLIVARKKDFFNKFFGPIKVTAIDWLDLKKISKSLYIELYPTSELSLNLHGINKKIINRMKKNPRNIFLDFIHFYKKQAKAENPRDTESLEGLKSKTRTFTTSNIELKSPRSTIPQSQTDIKSPRLTSLATSQKTASINLWGSKSQPHKPGKADPISPRGAKTEPVMLTKSPRAEKVAGHSNLLQTVSEGMEDQQRHEHESVNKTKALRRSKIKTDISPSEFLTKKTTELQAKIKSILQNNNSEEQLLDYIKECWNKFMSLNKQIGADNYSSGLLFSLYILNIIGSSDNYIEIYNLLSDVLVNNVKITDDQENSLINYIKTANNDNPANEQKKIEKKSFSGFTLLSSSRGHKSVGAKEDSNDDSLKKILVNFLIDTSLFNSEIREFDRLGRFDLLEALEAVYKGLH